uniref:WW domain-containing protein n=1 Tax=Salarias fasciatus TaxID=181472 RepID=A0A672H0R1_SALFA
MSIATPWGKQVVCVEEHDEDYEPTEEDIREFAIDLGIDPDTEPELLFLAREGYVARLPPEWRPSKDEEGNLYYFNFSTGQSTWEHPTNEYFRRLVEQERELIRHAASAQALKQQPVKTPGAKKRLTKKRAAKTKHLDTTPGASTSSLGASPSPLRKLPPLRGIQAPSQDSLPDPFPVLQSSLSRTPNLLREPVQTFSRLPSIGAHSSLTSIQEETGPGSRGSHKPRKKVHFALDEVRGGLQDEETDSSPSENAPDSPVSDRLLKNVHFNLNEPRGGLQDEDKGRNLVPPERRTKPEFQDLAMSRNQSSKVFPLQDCEARRKLEEASSSVDVQLDSKDLTGRLRPLEEKEKVRRDTEPELEEARELMLKDKERKIQRLKQELQKQEEQEERRLTEQNEEILRTLRQRLHSRRTEEEAKLIRESEQKLEEFKQSAQKEREQLQHQMREEITTNLKELQFSIEKEREAERSRMEDQRQRMLKDKERRIQRLKQELQKQEEQEERRLKEQNEEILGTLQQRLHSRRTEEEAKLIRESEQKLEEFKQCAQKEMEEFQHQMREDRTAFLKELQFSIEKEREAASRRETERLKKESEEELQAERRRLRREEEDRLSGVLREVRDEVEREHERKLEQMKQQHRREISSIREKYQEEKAAQRDEMLSSLQFDRQQLQDSLTLQLDALRLELDAQINNTQLAHSRKQSELRDLASQLELEEQQLKIKEALLLAKAEELQRRREKLSEEQLLVDREVKTLPWLIQDRDQLKEQLREEKARALEDRIKAREQERRLEEERDQGRVAELQGRCDRLSLRGSQLDQQAGEQRLIPSFSAPPPAVRTSQSSLAFAPMSDSTATPLFSTPISTSTSGVARASDQLTNSRWSSRFPGASIDPVTSRTQRTSWASSSYAAGSSQSAWSTARSAETDRFGTTALILLEPYEIRVNGIADGIAEMTNKNGIGIKRGIFFREKMEPYSAKQTCRGDRPSCCNVYVTSTALLTC